MKNEAPAKHPDGYIACPLGMKGVLAAEGDTCELAPWLKPGLPRMPEFPIDAPKRRVVKALETLGFSLVREREHIAMNRENPDGIRTPYDHA